MDLLLAWLERHQGLASWVQAVGVVVSLAGAIFIASSQSRSEAKRARQSKIEAVRQKLDSFLSLAKYAESEITEAVRSFKEEDEVFVEHFKGGIEEKRTVALLGCFENVPFHEMPDQTTAFDAITIYESFATCTQLLRDCIALHSTDTVRYGVLFEQVEKVYLEVLQEATRSFESAATDLLAKMERD